MSLQYSITKNTAAGENLIVHISQCNPVTGDVMHSVEEMDAMLQKANDSTTERMFDMNMAMLEAFHLDAYFEPGTWIKVKQVMEVLAGRMQAQVLQHRWQSAQEETAELERVRAVQAQQVGLRDSVSVTPSPQQSVVTAETDPNEPRAIQDDVNAELHNFSPMPSYYNPNDPIQVVPEDSDDDSSLPG